MKAHGAIMLAALWLASAALARPPAAADARGNVVAALARAAAQAERWDTAARLWRDLTLARPDDAAAWAGLGHALLGLDRTDDAAAALDRAMALVPSVTAFAPGDAAQAPADTSLVLDRSRAALQQGDGATARRLFAALAARRPADPRVWTGLGVALDLGGRHGEAQQAYDRALALDPLDAAARANMAISRQLADAGRNQQ